MTIQHSIIGNVDLHEPKGINTALNNQTYKANGLGSGVWTAVQEPANRIAINSLSDFPAPSAGVITLAADTDYVLGAPLSTADRFVVSNNTQISSTSFLHNTLTYTGTGTMFTGIDVSFRANECRFLAATGTVFDFQHTVINIHQANLRSVVVENCAKWGTFGNCLSVVHTNCAMLAGTDGLTLTGTNTLIDITQYGLQSAGGASFIGIDFGTAVNTIVSINNLQILSLAAGATGISGLVSGGNLATGQIGRISQSAFIGAITVLAGLTEDDVNWKYSDNDGIEDTIPDALISMNSNATNTVISAINTPTLVAGTWVVNQTSHFTGTTAGRATYDGIVGLTTPIDIILNLEPVSGTNKDLAVYVAKNGTEIVATGMLLRTNAGVPAVLSTMWQDSLSTTDFIEVFVENRTDAIDILVNDVILRIR